jgi:Fuc2NAc and GlcNAc transferase
MTIALGSGVLLLVGTSWLCTAALRRFALRRSILDLPNRRSLHAEATPRGGGLGIAGYGVAAPLLLAVAGLLPPLAAGVLSVSGGLVALVGWLDDVQSQGVLMRLAVHLLACGAVAYVAGPTAGILAAVMVAVAMVWLLNLYNFMDGIDGIAGLQAVVASVFMAFLLRDALPGLSLFLLGLAAMCAGFLMWNWAPARIFLGDVGSGFLGFTFAAVVLKGQTVGGVPAYLLLSPLAPFVLDATITLAVRLARRERIHEAHRSHLYQRLVQAGWSHSAVACCFALASAAGGFTAIAVQSHGTLAPVAIVVYAMVLLALAGLAMFPHRARKDGRVNFQTQE